MVVTPESVAVTNHIIKENVPKETVAAYEKSVSPYVTRPNCPRIEFSCDVDYNIICLIQKQMQQEKLPSCVSFRLLIRQEKNCFSQYILPDNSIDKYATRVNKLTVKSVDSNRTLFKDDDALITLLTSQEAISRFVSYVQQCINSCKLKLRRKATCAQF